MPIVFLFSAMVSGIAAVMLLYVVGMKLRKTRSTCAAWTPSRRYLFYTFIIDFTLEMLDLIHRTYESDESFRSLDFMVHTRLLGFAGDGADSDRDARAALVLLAATQLWSILRGEAPRDVRDGVRPDPGRHLRDALERSDRRPAVLQELPGIHELQNGLRDARRPVRRPLADAAALRDSLSCW